MELDALIVELLFFLFFFLMTAIFLVESLTWSSAEEQSAFDA